MEGKVHLDEFPIRKATLPDGSQGYRVIEEDSGDSYFASFSDAWEWHCYMLKSMNEDYKNSHHALLVVDGVHESVVFED